MRYLLILLLTGCASQLTEDEQFQREYEEADRKVQYRRWEQACEASNGIVYAYRPTRICRKRGGCIPDAQDWKWDTKRERPKHSNTVVCTSRDQLKGMF